MTRLRDAQRQETRSSHTMRFRVTSRPIAIDVTPIVQAMADRAGDDEFRFGLILAPEDVDDPNQCQMLVSGPPDGHFNEFNLRSARVIGSHTGIIRISCPLCESRKGHSLQLDPYNIDTPLKTERSRGQITAWCHQEDRLDCVWWSGRDRVMRQGVNPGAIDYGWGDTWVNGEKVFPNPAPSARWSHDMV